MTATIQELLKQIKPIDQSLAPLIQRKLDNLTKPLGSLGRLEEMALRYSLVHGGLKLPSMKKRIYTLAGDHGVCDEKVSAFPQAVTGQMVQNMAGGGAGVNVLAKHAGAEVKVVNMGVMSELVPCDEVIDVKIRPGSRNFTRFAAMDEDHASQAVMAGVELAEQSKADKVSLLGMGEMGIANSTSAAALYTALLPEPAETWVGRGSGVDDEGVQRKIQAVNKGLKLHPQAKGDPWQALVRLGGFEIAGMVGLALGAAKFDIPLVVDGYIASAAALVAIKMAPEVAEYLFFSHCSAEGGHRRLFEHLQDKPLLDLDMRLGEGTGAALAMGLIEAGVKCMQQMATFDSAQVSEKLD